MATHRVRHATLDPNLTLLALRGRLVRGAGFPFLDPRPVDHGWLRRLGVGLFHRLMPRGRLDR